MARFGSVGSAAWEGRLDAADAAVTFAAEFARLGYSGPRILRLFADPFYTEAHAALRCLGERTVRDIVVTAITHCRPLTQPVSAERTPLREG